MTRSSSALHLVACLILMWGCDSSDVTNEQQEIDDRISAPTGLEVGGTLESSVPRLYTGDATFTRLLGTTTITMILDGGSVNVNCVLTLLGPLIEQKYDIGPALDAGKLAVQVTFVDSDSFDSITLSHGEARVYSRTDTRVKGYFSGNGTSIYTGSEFKVAGKFDARCLAGFGDCSN